MGSPTGQGAVNSPHQYLSKAALWGIALCALIVGLSTVNKSIGSRAFQLNTPLEYVVILCPPLLAATMIGAYRDYRVTGQKGMLFLATAGVVASVSLFLFMAWVASIAAGTR